MKRCICILYFVTWIVWIPTLVSAPTSFSTLEVGNQVYYRVKVKDVTPQSLVIFHSKGISQVMLKDLPEELQRAYGYSAEAERQYLANSQLKHARARARVEENKKKPTGDSSQTAPKKSSVDVVLSRFGQTPAIADEVDLRPEFRRLGLGSKNQGMRPSCSVFAVVSALEFQNAKLAGNTEKLSEEYLIWATRKSLGLGKESLTYDEDAKDTGFALLEVVQALRSYGIPLESAMPNTFGKSMAKITSPAEAIIAQARSRRKVYAYLVTGRDQVTKIDNILHTLNAGIPVVLGIQWPVASTLYNAPILSKQKPRDDYAHAITLVGYRADAGKRDRLRFVFKNSWGNKWGINGYGWVTYEYLKKHLHSAIVLDVGY